MSLPIVFSALTLLLAGALPGNYKAPGPGPSTPLAIEHGSWWIPPYAKIPVYPWKKIADCETNSQWSRVDHSGYFRGGLGISWDFWLAYRPDGVTLWDITDASPYVQIMTARNIVRLSGLGFGAWQPCGRNVW